MRLFVCSDIHMATENLERLLEKAGAPIDAVLFAGDLTNWGSRADAIKVLSSFKIRPVITIPGNLDTEGVMEVLEERSELIHGRRIFFNDWNITGFGGGSLNNPGDILFGDEAITQGLEPLLKESDSKQTILVTHQPPFDTKLDIVRGEHVGSKAVRELIEKYRPAYHFCGHIHESFGEEAIGNTRSYNVAAVKEGRAAVLDLKKSSLQRFSLS